MSKIKMTNIDKLKEKYKKYWKDKTHRGGLLDHKNYHFVFGDYTVSVIQEPYCKGDNDLEYAIIYKGGLTFLEKEGDSVARYKGIEEVNAVLQHYKQKEEKE